MMVRLKKNLPWLVPAALALAGAVFYFGISGCGFLGILLFGLAGISAVFRVLTLWQKRSQKPAGAVKLGLSIFKRIVRLCHDNNLLRLGFLLV